MTAPEVAWDRQGLVPAIVQDASDGSVLMLAYMNVEALERTLETGFVHFWSRSRDELWRKGDTSGNTLRLVGIAADCDGDALLVAALPSGPTCHTGTETCFGERAPASTLGMLWATIADRRENPQDGSYTNELLEGGTDAVARKVVEEAGEVVLAAKNHESGGDASRVVEEAADVVYHLLVLLAERGLTLRDVEAELGRRAEN